MYVKNNKGLIAIIIILAILVIALGVYIFKGGKYKTMGL